MEGLVRLGLVCLGSALGGGARHLVVTGGLALFGPAFPVGTLAVNVLGSFAISLVMYAGVETQSFSTETRLFLTVGFLGGFTTYSSFNYELLGLMREGFPVAAAAYFALTVLLALGAGLAGLAAGRAWVGG